MRTQVYSAEQSSDAAAVIRKGGLVVFPTETVYGLGASAFNPGACARIFSAKGRPSDNPLIVHVADEERLAEVVGELPEAARRLKEAFWPGPLSLIVPKNPALPDLVTAGLPTVAVRWPRSPQAQAFLRECGVPVAAPSANVSGAPSPTTFEMAKGAMLGRVDAILAGDDCEEGLESTIVGFVDGRPKVLRPGSLTAVEIAGVLGIPPQDLAYTPPTEGRPVSPGLKYTHYKPNAEVRLFTSATDLAAIPTEGQKVAVMTLAEAETPEGGWPADWEVRVAADLRAYGRGLYSSFFEFDRIGCTLICAYLPAAEGLGAAVANRLTKAAGQ